MPAQRRPPGGKDKSEGGGSVQSGRGKEINRAVFLRIRMCPAARNTAERGDECAEHVLSRAEPRQEQVPPDPRGCLCGWERAQT